MRVCDWKQSSDEDRFNFILIKSKATLFNKIWNVSHAINDYFFICVDFQVNESLEHQITEVKCLFKFEIHIYLNEIFYCIYNILTLPSPT